MNTTITNELLQAILNYMASKPFQEVAAMIQELQRQFAEQNTPRPPEAVAQ